MQTLVVGDVHGCIDELAELAGRVGPDRIVFVGDLFTKGPEPEKVWAFARDNGCEAVLGNHDERLLEAVSGHRGRDAEALACIARLDAADRAWLDWLRGRPLFIEDVAGFTVVHASVHPTGSLEKTTREMAINWRRWPNDDAGAAPWHKVYRGERRVIFGHDARGGLVRMERNGVPWLIGLDTGCVYGGKLSGYVPEEDRVVQVPARRTYRSVEARS